MKKKLLLSVIVMFMLFTGVVTAASINGDFQGNPIVKVKSNGQVLPIEDTPAILYNNRTMVPIYLLRQLGVEVEWIAEEYAVDLRLPKRDNSSDAINSLSGYSKLINNGLLTRKINAKSTFIIDEYGLILSFIYTIPSNISDQQYLDELIYMATRSNLLKDTDYKIDMTIIETRAGFTETAKIYITHQSVLDYMDGKLDTDSFINTWVITNANQYSTTQPSTSAPSLSYPELYSNDGKTFLGKLTTNIYDSESIYNEYGTYGSKYSANSIWNKYGTYGSEFSDESAFNDLATKPPIIVLDVSVK
jgi:hypothetical protein